jgi:hypothetical protein
MAPSQLHRTLLIRVSERGTPHITVQEVGSGVSSTFASWGDFLRYAEALDAPDPAARGRRIEGSDTGS